MKEKKYIEVERLISTLGINQFSHEVQHCIEKHPEIIADVRENVHGHWIRSDWNGANIRYTCSRCQLSIVTNEDYIKKHRFCFACGAIMAETECQHA